MNKKIMKTILGAILAGLTMAGIYFNIPIAIWFAWGLFSLVLFMWLVFHLCFESTATIKKDMLKTYEQRNNRSIFLRLYYGLWSIAWVALFVVVERYNLLGVYIGIHIATQFMWLRVSDLEK